MVFWPDRTVQMHDPDTADTLSLQAHFHGFQSLNGSHPAPELDAFHRGEIPLTEVPRLSYGPRDDPDSCRQACP